MQRPANIPFELNAPFVPFTAVKDYFTIKRVYMLLGAVFPHEDFVVDALTIRDRYPKVFCILLTLRRRHLISYFYNDEIQDDRFPVSSSYRSPSFDRYFEFERYRPDVISYNTTLSPGRNSAASDGRLPQPGLGGFDDRFRNE